MLVALGTSLLIAGVTMSFQAPFGPMQKWDSLTELQDTIPEKVSTPNEIMTIKNYDDLMLKMEKEILKMQAEMAKVDLAMKHKNISGSLNKGDFDKIRQDIVKAMKSVDFAKIEAGVKTALKEVDWSKVNADVKKSLEDAKKEIEKIKMTEIKADMEKARQEIEKSKPAFEKINFHAVVKNTNKEILQATEELKLTKAMFNEMEQEGLIDQRSGFTVEIRNKSLSVNGIKQNDLTYDKYKKYIKGDSFKITISKE